MELTVQGSSTVTSGRFKLRETTSLAKSSHNWWQQVVPRIKTPTRNRAHEPLITRRTVSSEFVFQRELGRCLCSFCCLYHFYTLLFLFVQATTYSSRLAHCHCSGEVYRYVSKVQGMDLEITTAAALRGHSRGHSSPEKITALPSNQTGNTSIELINTSIELINTSIELINTSIETYVALAFSSMHALNIMFTSPQLLRNTCYHAIKGALFLPELQLHSLASPAFITIVCSEDKELTLYKSSLVIRVSPTGFRA